MTDSSAPQPSWDAFCAAWATAARDRAELLRAGWNATRVPDGARWRAFATVLTDVEAALGTRCVHVDAGTPLGADALASPADVLVRTQPEVDRSRGLPDVTKDVATLFRVDGPLKVILTVNFWSDDTGRDGCRADWRGALVAQVGLARNRTPRPQGTVGLLVGEQHRSKKRIRFYGLAADASCQLPYPASTGEIVVELP